MPSVALLALDWSRVADDVLTVWFCSAKELGENGAVIPKLSPPPLKLGTKGSVPKPFTPPIRHVHFEISSSVDLKEDIPDSPKERKGKETVTTPTISADKLPPVQISGNSGEQRMSQQLLAALGDEDNEDGLQASVFGKYPSLGVQAVRMTLSCSFRKEVKKILYGKSLWLPWRQQCGCVVVHWGEW